MEYIMANESYETILLPNPYVLQHNISVNSKNISTFAEIVAVCNKNGPIALRAYVQIFIIIVGLPANAVLLWMLVKNRKTMTPSEVLGLNIALIGLLFCVTLPLDISMSLTQNRSGLPMHFSQTFGTLCYFSCPLLLTCMCLERYVAVVHPVLFIKLGKWEYRAACSAIIWILTCITAGFMFTYTITSMALVLSFILDVLFVIMVVCLVGIMCVLCKKGPGEGDQNNSAIKKNAIKNVVAVLVPSTITYMPSLALAPIVLVINILLQKESHMGLCQLILLFAVLPNAGVCIGPMFYMARVWRMLRGRNNESGNTSKPTTVQTK